MSVKVNLHPKVLEFKQGERQLVTLAHYLAIRLLDAAVQPSIAREAELCAAIIEEAHRRIRLGLTIANRADASTMARMAVGHLGTSTPVA